ncbi:MAG: VOC family protein [Planctomycetota bacterium]
MGNAFVWADLSTFDLAEAKRFYADCFGWRYEDVGDGYAIGAAGGHAAAGMYPMPEKFQAIEMPSFWMSYIGVDDLAGVVSKAEALGGKIEVAPEPAPGGGTIALVRDPAGAGFTCHEGDLLQGRPQPSGVGCVAWHELHVSDLARVEPFYAGVFGWRLRPTDRADRHEFVDADGRVVAGVTVTPNAVKGDKEYWGVYFATDDLNEAAARIERAGGKIEASQPLGDRDARLARDTQDAAFYLVQHKSKGTAAAKPATPSSIKWRAIGGLVLAACAIAFDATWLWGVMFLLWVLPDLWRGSTYFFEQVDRRRNPVLFWVIVVTWIALSAAVLFYGWPTSG